MDPRALHQGGDLGVPAEEVVSVLLPKGQQAAEGKLLVAELAAARVEDLAELLYQLGSGRTLVVLLVQAARAVTGELTMTVHHRRPLADGKVGLEVPVLQNAARQWGFGAVAAGGAVELRELSVENGCEIDPRGLPDSLRSPEGEDDGPTGRR